MISIECSPTWTKATVPTCLGGGTSKCFTFWSVTCLVYSARRAVLFPTRCRLSPLNSGRAG
jgi:hypothetical protein